MPTAIDEFPRKDYHFYTIVSSIISPCDSARCPASRLSPPTCCTTRWSPGRGTIRAAGVSFLGGGASQC